VTRQEILERELERLTPDDPPWRKAQIRNALSHNLSTWDELLANDQVGSKWLLLDAYVARTDAQEQWGSLLHSERLSWATDVARRLLREHGHTIAGGIPQALHILSRLLGGHETTKARDAYRSYEEAQKSQPTPTPNTEARP
jgi:hypothetical protein